MIRPFLLNLAMAMLLPTAALAAPRTPHDIVATLYAQYLADPHAEHVSKDDKSALDLIRPYADASLGKAIDADNACQVQEQGICNMDFDVLIDGQDWDLSGFHIQDEAEAGGRQTIRAVFINGIPHRISFAFVKTKAGWRIHDATGVAFTPGGKVRASWSLLALLNRPQP